MRSADTRSHKSAESKVGKQMPERELLLHEIHGCFFWCRYMRYVICVWLLVFVVYMFTDIYLYRAILILLCVIDLFTIYEWYVYSLQNVVCSRIEHYDTLYSSRFVVYDRVRLYISTRYPETNIAPEPESCGWKTAWFPFQASFCQFYWV